MSREVMQQALDALAFIDRAVQGDEEMWPARGKWSYTRTRIADASVALRAALAAPQGKPVQESVAWLRVIDEAMVTHHLGVADLADDYETAKRKMDNLLSHAQDIGAYFAAPPAAPQDEPVAVVYELPQSLNISGGAIVWWTSDSLPPGTKLYAAPPAAPSGEGA